jgi:hypothetical protein
MARDPKKKYLSIGLEEGSWGYEQLMKDARLHQMDGHLPGMAIVRLIEYYRLAAVGIVIPGVTVLASGEAPTVVEKADQGVVAPPFEESILEAGDVGANLEAGMSYFLEE